MTTPWWKGAVFYQIYPRSFLDTDGDGVGDLEGIRRRLPYIKALGVDAIWLSPIFRSPMADYGYDVSDYRDIDPLFGDLAGFDRLLADAHEHGLRLIVDFVPNHTSDQHDWFIDARSSKTSAHRDWYVWRDGVPDKPPNAWPAAFTSEPAWTWDKDSKQWYLRLFLAEQPDLDWANPAVVDAMHDVLRFWLDRGVDGFRVDVVHLLGKDIDDSPYPTPSPLTHELMRGLRRLVDGYPDDRMLVGETFIMSTKGVAEFYGDNDELHLCFNFPPLFTAWDPVKWRKRIQRATEEFDPIGAWPVWVLSNHDNPRHRTRYGSAARARAACLMLLGLRGTPFLYAGEELGLEDAVIPPARVVDPGGRDGCRAPIPWEPALPHGWATPNPWLPWPPGQDAATQEDDPRSFLRLYRDALAVRAASPALARGDFAWIPSATDVLAWRRTSGDDEVVVAINFSDDASPLDTLPGAWRVESATDPELVGGTFSKALNGSSAVWLRRA